MVKHNNIIPNVHCHKDWKRYVRTWLNQAGRKKTRRLARQKKAAKLSPRPIGLLRPVVHPPTRRYNLKTRIGRGFTLEELKAAGISKKVARTIGISVDHRRHNHCAESLNLNTQRIKTYVSKLVIFPRKSKAKNGIGGIPKDTVRSGIANVASQPIEKVVPMEKPSKKIKARAITEEDRRFMAYATLRRAVRDAAQVGKKKETTDGVAAV